MPPVEVICALVALGKQPAARAPCEMLLKEGVSSHLACGIRDVKFSDGVGGRQVGVEKKQVVELYPNVIIRQMDVPLPFPNSPHLRRTSCTLRNRCKSCLPLAMSTCSVKTVRIRGVSEKRKKKAIHTVNI